jgi:sulfofructose kinase
MSGALDVLGVGYNTEDHVCVADGPPVAGSKTRLRTYFAQPGGQVPTALVALQRWGLTTAYMGPVGDDGAGARQLASLRDEGVAVDGCVRRAGVASHLSFITVDAASGERTILWHRDDRLALRPGELDTSAATGARALLLDGDDIDAAIEMAAAARRGGALVMLDVDRVDARTKDLLAVTDLAIVPQEFARDFAGAEPAAALRAICACGPAVAAVTLGAAGVVARGGGREYRQEAFSVEAVDTTSAGDVFHAGFLYDFLDARDIQRALRFAAVAAALATTKLGGRASIPARGDVRARLASP